MIVCHTVKREVDPRQLESFTVQSIGHRGLCYMGNPGWADVPFYAMLEICLCWLWVSERDINCRASKSSFFYKV